METPEFDEWVAQRGAALLRFAYLLTRDHARAEEAVQDALIAAYSRWSRICRGQDPEAYVRRSIVNADISRWRRFLRRETPTADLPPSGSGPDHAETQAEQDAVWTLCATLPTKQRAAVVLRYYEDLPDADIAEDPRLLAGHGPLADPSCAGIAAHHHRNRGGQALMDASEKLIADTLSKHAADAPADDHLLSVVHARLRRRRTGRSIGAVVVAAAVVATAVTVSHSLTTETRTDPQVSRPGPADPGWRWESYKTVQVQVPSSWTQYISGPAPCTTFANSAVPSVGRLNGWLGKNWYTCGDAVLPLNRRQPYLWFDDVQAPGTKQYDGGWTEETRLVGGTKISVLTQDDALRRRILESARPITGTDYYGCAPTDLGPQGTGLDAKDQITSADVCEYWQWLAGLWIPARRRDRDRVRAASQRLTGRSTISPRRGVRQHRPAHVRRHPARPRQVLSGLDHRRLLHRGPHLLRPTTAPPSAAPTAAPSACSSKASTNPTSPATSSTRSAPSPRQTAELRTSPGWRWEGRSPWPSPAAAGHS